MEDLILRYGLPAVFIGAMAEGDLTLILGGVLVHLGLLHPVSLLLVAVGGLFCVDAVWFALGHYAAPRLAHLSFYQRVAAKVDELGNRLGPLELLLSRVIYGTRVASMIYWGTRHLPVWRFAVIDLVGCVLWALVLGGVGYALSGSAAVIIGDVKRIELWLLGAALVAAAIVVVVHRLGKKAA